MSEFVIKDNAGNWKITKPKFFKSEEMIARTVKQFRSVDSDPMQMGRSAGTYEAVRSCPSTIMEVIRDMKAKE